MNESGDTEWTQFIKINPETNSIDIEHNSVPSLKNNSEYKIYLMGVSKGLNMNYKVINFKFSHPPINQAPKFEEPIKELVVDVDGDKLREGTLKPFLVYDFPTITDAEGNNPDFEISFKKKPPCNCVFFSTG